MPAPLIQAAQPESPIWGILRNAAAGLIVAAVVAIIGAVAKYWRRIRTFWANFVKTVNGAIVALEDADSQFTVKLAEHEVEDDRRHEETKAHLDKQDKQIGELKHSVGELKVQRTQIEKKLDILVERG